MTTPKVLILTLPHGASHDRLAQALRKALIQIRPGITVEILNALEHCAPWFRLYYNSYQIPLKYWPALWGWIESAQHSSNSTSPAWLYRRGGRPLLGHIQALDPDIVVATEVGLCEMAALFKRECGARYRLVAAPPEAEIDRAWAQAEVDLYLLALPETAAQLQSAGIASSRICTCGPVIDPAFDSLPDRAAARARLGLSQDKPVVLVLFGGTGIGTPRRVLKALEKLPPSFEVVLIAGKNARLEQDLRRRAETRPQFRALGWVDNVHAWMAAADVLASKPGAATVFEAINSRLPLLALDPLPGEERRTCHLIEQWGVGHWVRHWEELPSVLARLLTSPEELERLRRNAEPLRRPRAAHAAAEAVSKLLPQTAVSNQR